jgi:hypothetical protein
LKVLSRIRGWVILGFLFNAFPFLTYGDYLIDGCLNFRRGRIVCGEEAEFWLIFTFVVPNAALFALGLTVILNKKKSFQLNARNSKVLPKLECLSSQGQLLVKQVLD